MRYLGSQVGLAPDYEKTWFTELVTLPISQNMSLQVAKEIVERLEKAYNELI
jgi:3-methyladenine DNA glycosylase/8-oxoguanine DNA glycosylase